MDTKKDQWITKAVQLLKQLETAGTDVSYDDDYSDYDNYSCDPLISDCCPIWIESSSLSIRTKK